jgi:shikimate dehydrogenase
VSDLWPGEGATRPHVAWPAASTTGAGLIGFPARHSLSPRLHNAAYAALGIDWAYLAFEVAAPAAAAAVVGAAALGLRGLSVTTPHKEAAAELATRRSPTVRRIGAANTLTFDGDEIVAESTDGQGLLDDLRENAGVDPAGQRCFVLGAGSAARAVVLALAEAGAAEVMVCNRSPSRAWRAAALAPRIGRVARPEEVERAAIVVQATSVGLAAVSSGDAVALPGGPGGVGAVAAVRSASDPPVAGRLVGGLLDPDRLGGGQLVVDLVYTPPVTAVLEAAAARGARTRSGLGMLVHQAARQVEIWTGAEAPLEAMWTAVGGREPPVA